MPENPKITIRLPELMAAKLSEVADQHKVTRTAILLDLLASGIDTWEPAQQRTTPSDVARLDGAIEVLRLELSEAIERIARLERQAEVRRRPTDIAQPRPAASGGVTQKAVLATIGLSRTTARDRAKKSGLSLGDWIEANSRYRRSGKLWILPTT